MQLRMIYYEKSVITSLKIGHQILYCNNRLHNHLAFFRKFRREVQRLGRSARSARFLIFPARGNTLKKLLNYTYCLNNSFFLEEFKFKSKNLFSNYL